MIDMVEESINWVESMALGREPFYSIMGACSQEEEEMIIKYIKEVLLSQLKTKGVGIL